jgi:protein gp37
MNEQGPKGIEWTNFTWNPVGGCEHDCKWAMPDGSIAQCYAKTIAEKFRKVYPEGFEHHYWRPHLLKEPLKMKRPARIFLDSMSDLMGAWVPDEQIQQVLEVASQAHWHTFQLLTKNAPRLLKFEFPPNVWVGVSAPPTFILGKEMDRKQQSRMLARTLDVLGQVKAQTTWMSIEPLSWDIAPEMESHPLQWIVIGAASNGKKVYQPNPVWVQNLLNLMDQTETPVFFKGNLKGNEAASVWRDDFPGQPRKVYPKPTELFQLPMFAELAGR